MKLQAYDENQVFNQQVRTLAADWLAEGKLTPPQYEAIQTAFPVGFRQGHLFQRFGLFVFSLFGCFAAVGLLAMVFSFGDTQVMGIYLFLVALVFLFLNESLIKNRQWYRFGSDNALSYVAAFFLMGGLSMLLDADNIWQIALICLPVCGLFAVRYGDPVFTLAGFYAFFCLIYELNWSAETSVLGLGSTLAISSLATYLWVKFAQTKSSLFYWKDCLAVLEIASLVALYASLNYYLLDNLKTYGTAHAPIFAVTTAVLPFIYLYWGIKNRDRILWILGGLGIGASILTYRHYFAVMPFEWACTLAGLSLLALAFSLMHFLKTPRRGIVYAPKISKPNFIEMLVLNQISPQAPAQTASENAPFGGGDFDGGGAGRTF
jgi:hypothetical protein